MMGLSMKVMPTKHKRAENGVTVLRVRMQIRGTMILVRISEKLANVRLSHSICSLGESPLTQK